jgi:outer membrane lipoprotein-sorting protein
MRLSGKWLAMFVLGLTLGLVQVGQAAKAAATDKAGHHSIVQTMRDNGFKHKTASWTTAMTVKDDTGKVTNSEAKMWLSGDKYRMANKDQNGKSMIMIDDGKETYMLNPAEKTAYKWGPGVESMYSSVLASDVVAESARQRKHAKKIGSEAVDGKPCDIYAYKSSVTFMGSTVTSDVKEWTWTSEKFPLKTVAKTPKHQMKIVFMTTDVPASESTNVIKDLVFDGPIDEGLFTLPAGTKVETMDMPQGMTAGEGSAAGRPAVKGKSGQPGSSGESEGSEGQNQKPPVDVNKMLKGLF